MKVTKEEIRDIAEEHYKYVESVCHKMFIDAFIHGFKHGLGRK